MLSNESVGFSPWALVEQDRTVLLARVFFLEHLVEKLLVFMTEHPGATLTYQKPEGAEATYRVAVRSGHSEFLGCDAGFVDATCLALHFAIMDESRHLVRAVAA